MTTTAIPLPDMQALLVTGFGGLTHARYLLLAVKDRRAAGDWLARLADPALRLLPDAAEVQPPVAQRRAEAVAIGFSAAGLAALGVQEDLAAPFPSTFSDGMGAQHRARGLGDAEAEAWRWADAPLPGPIGGYRRVVHLLVCCFHEPGHPPAALAGGLLDAAALGPAFDVVATIHGDPAYFRDPRFAIEPFGFPDGISQPVPVGLNARDERLYAQADARKRAWLEHDRVAPGEFVLGLPNEYGEKAHAPSVRGWTTDAPFCHGASYMAVRQIVQHVDRLKAFEAQHPGIADKIIGRRRADGQPLCPFDPADGDNAFGYAVADAHGFGCPRGAHARRANPRDTLGQTPEEGIRHAKLHRLLRRGRSYARVEPGGDETGMMFIAFNADIDRQFALVQRRWIAGSRFNDLANEADPLLGERHRAFTLPAAGGGRRLQGLPRFTTVVGGGYFLLPALGALAFIARTAAAAP